MVNAVIEFCEALGDMMSPDTDRLSQWIHVSVQYLSASRISILIQIAERARTGV
jgi:hypothetical protein